METVPAGTKVTLPYHKNPETGEPITIELTEDVPAAELQGKLEEAFPWTVGNTINQISTPGAPPVSREQFNEAMEYAQGVRREQYAREKQDPVNTAGFISVASDVVKEAIGAAARGIKRLTGDVYETGQTVLAGNWEQKAMAPVGLAARLAEGVFQGGEQLIQTGALLTNLAMEKLGASDPYDVYNMHKIYEKTNIDRELGQTILFGENKQIAESANDLKNILDPSILFPMFKGLSGVAKQGAEAAAKEAVSVGLARQAAAKTLALVERGGVAAEKATTAAAKAAVVAAPAGVVFGQGATALNALAVAGVAYPLGKASKAMGHIAGVAGKILGSDETAQVILSQAIDEVADDAVKKGVYRLAAKLVPPEEGVRVIRDVVGAGIEGATFGAVSEFAREASDPLATAGTIAEKTLLGGVGGGAVGGAMGGITSTGKEITGTAKKEAFVKAMARDFMTRPEDYSVDIGGNRIIVPDELSNRAKMAKSELSIDDKRRMFGVLSGFEQSGGEVVFINNDTPLPDALGGSGAGMGEGARVTREGGRPVVFINADTANHLTALEEVTHAIVSDNVADTILKDRIAKSNDPNAVITDLTDFGRKYLAELGENHPASQKVADALALADNPHAPIADKVNALAVVNQEYIAKGVSEALKGKAPDSFYPSSGSTIWQDVASKMGDVFTLFSTNDEGASFDMSNGHFYKDGKRVSEPTLEKTAQNVLNYVQGVENDIAKADNRKPIVIGTTGEDGGTILQVVKARPRPEAVVPEAGGLRAASKKEQQAERFNVSEQFKTIVEPQNVDPEVVAKGGYAGNIQKGRVMEASTLTPEQVQQIADIQTRLGPLIPEENRAGFSKAVDGMNKSILLSIDSSSHQTKDPTSPLAARMERVVLPVSVQLGEVKKTGNSGGLPYMRVVDVTMIRDVLNGTSDPKAKAALDAFGIKKLEDVAPIVKQWIENYSAATPNPGADALAAIAPPKATREHAVILRDLLNGSANMSADKYKRVNELSVQPDVLPAYKADFQSQISGRSKLENVARDRSIFGSIRLDSIMDARPYLLDGKPVQILADKRSFPEKIGINFSPRKVRRETMRGGEIITDPESGERIVVGSSGSAKLFKQDRLAGVYDSYDEAVFESNKRKIKEARAASKAYQVIEPKRKDIASIRPSQKAAGIKEMIDAQMAKNATLRKQADTQAKKLASIEIAKRQREEAKVGYAKVDAKVKESLDTFHQQLQQSEANAMERVNQAMSADRRRLQEGVKNATVELPDISKPTQAAPPKDVVTSIEDPVIPRGMGIQKTPSGKFKVWSISANSSVAGVTETYKEAVKMAQRKSKKK